MQLNNDFEKSQNATNNAQNSARYTPLSDIDIDALAQIDPTAAHVLNSAINTATAILKHREYLDDDGRQDTPLYIVAGETHDIPAHTLHHMLVLNMLTATGDKVVCGIEHEENSVHTSIETDFAIKTSHPLYKKHFRSADNSDNLALEWRFANTLSRFAPYTSKVFENYLIESGMPVRFTDANEERNTNPTHEKSSDLNTNKHYLDANDPQTAESMMACDQPLQNPLSSFEDNGIWVRNHHGAQRLIEHATRHKARFAVNISGNYHVDGRNIIYSKLSKEQSFTACLKNAGVPALGILLENIEHVAHPPHIQKSSNWRTTILNGVLAQLDNIHVEGKLSHIRFDQDKSRFIGDLDQSDEKIWLDIRLQNLGLEQTVLNNLDSLTRKSTEKMSAIVEKEIIVPMRMNASMDRTSEHDLFLD